MANLNKVHLIGRLTRNPEVKDFQSGACVAEFGFAVNNQRKGDDGTWEDKPVFLDCKAWNRGKYELAAIVGEHLSKGSQCYIEGHLDLEQWKGQDGEKRKKLVVLVDKVEFLGAKKDAAGDQEGEDERPRKRGKPARQQRNEESEGNPDW